MLFSRVNACLVYFKLPDSICHIRNNNTPKQWWHLSFVALLYISLNPRWKSKSLFSASYLNRLVISRAEGTAQQWWDLANVKSFWTLFSSFQPKIFHKIKSTWTRKELDKYALDKWLTSDSFSSAVWFYSFQKTERFACFLIWGIYCFFLLCGRISCSLGNKT